MLMPDVNVLVYAHRSEAHRHEASAAWITNLATSEEIFALSEIVMWGFVRIVTNRKIFDPPSTRAEAFAFLDQLRNRPTCRVMRPGKRHWGLFTRLCHQAGATGKLTADACHAALAVECGCEWVTYDSDFSRFQPLLRCQLLK